MENLMPSILFGVLGGLVRALVGILKYFEKNKKHNDFKFWYLAFSLVVSAIVGGIAGVLADMDWRFTLLAGYAGVDFLEGLYKIRMKQGFEI